MRFLDKEAIGIKFYHQPTREILFFKAYLEKNDIEYKIEEHVLPNLQAGSGFSHLTLRTLNNISLEFNVFSEELEEAVENYQKLHLLISFFKGDVLYNAVNKSITYDPSSNDPRSKLFFSFKGMPRILNNKILDKDSNGNYVVDSNPELTIDDIPIQIFNFSYNINKEMGYIQTPADYKDRADGKLFVDNMALVPIAYKVSISCRVAADAEYLNDISYATDTPIEKVLPSFRAGFKAALEGRSITNSINSPVTTASAVAVTSAASGAKKAAGSPEKGGPPKKSEVVGVSGYSFVDTDATFSAFPIEAKRYLVKVLQTGIPNTPLDKDYARFNKKSEILIGSLGILEAYSKVQNALNPDESVAQLYIRDPKLKAEIETKLKIEIKKIVEVINFGIP